LAIKASSSRQIDALIADLAAAGDVTRDTAVARLTLLGARAVERLIAAAADGPPQARAAAWRALEAIGDARALDPALAVLGAPDRDPAVSVAAAGVARAHLRRRHGARALDRLAAVLLEPSRHETLRLAALRALRDLGPAAIAPILASLADDPSPAIRTEAGLSNAAAPRRAEDPAAIAMRAADGDLPDDPAALRHALNLSGDTVALPALVKVVDRVREREGSEPAAVRDQWRLARAAAHVALARRGSHLALYDLRESLEASNGPLPVEFLAAIALIADASCVEAIAAAHAKAKDGWWRHHLADAFLAIVQREKLTRRHAAIRKAEKKWKRAVEEMWAGKAGRAG
jgi:HEAT repeat protein